MSEPRPWFTEQDFIEAREELAARAERAAEDCDNETFTAIMAEVDDLIPDKELSEEFAVSRPTIARWRKGLNRPQPAVRKFVLKFVAERVRKGLLTQEAAKRDAEAIVVKLKAAIEAQGDDRYGEEVQTHVWDLLRRLEGPGELAKLVAWEVTRPRGGHRLIEAIVETAQLQVAPGEEPETCPECGSDRVGYTFIPGTRQEGSYCDDCDHYWNLTLVP